VYTYIDLQHFDIKSLQDSVDWFNVMSYDMHGTWDQNNTWVGPFLNPHTNLTEIKAALDLLWRNDIQPAKVTMGLAYYGRSFTLSSPDCFEPGCTYLSGGNAGECSDTVGFLLNSEIQAIITDNRLTPQFYQEDAVKAIHWGDQWVSYDDADTFKIRGDFAKSQCLGGVMVWAISHDDHQSTSAEGLMSGLGKKRMPFPSYSAPTATSSKLARRDESASDNVNVCRWTNCNEDCPAGWRWIRRADSDTLSMTDQTGCSNGDNPHKFCCPGDVDLPTCQWRGMPKRGGNCSPGCNDDEVEVGTLGFPFCQTRHQSACCTVTPSTSPYGQCKWVGSANLCSSSGSHADCPSDYPTFVFASSNGAGGEQTCSQGGKSYCCKGDVPWQFQKCSWQQGKDGYTFCRTSCPEGQTRLGMHSGGCGFGWEAYCCAGNPPPPPKADDDGGDGGDDDEDLTSVERRDPNHLYYYEYQSLIERYMQDPGAPPDFKSYSWSPEENQALLTRTVLNLYDFRLFNTYNARTMASNVQPLIDLYDDTGPPVEFGDHFLMAEMNAVIEGAGDRIDPYAYVSDLMANPHTANVAMDYMDTAAADLCTLVDEESTVSSKRSAPPLGDLENDYDPDLLKRHINVVDASTEPKVGGQPTMRTILRGIRNGDLTLHYARWEHFGDLNNDGRSAGPLLEIAYWIGREVGTLGSNANLYQDSDEDRWVVFHFHYANVRRLPYMSPIKVPSDGVPSSVMSFSDGRN
jgi:chitinase